MSAHLERGRFMHGFTHRAQQKGHCPSGSSKAMQCLPCVLKHSHLESRASHAKHPTTLVLRNQAPQVGYVMVFRSFQPNFQKESKGIFKQWSHLQLLNPFS